jgi:preprotein translocase subunit SecD
MLKPIMALMLGMLSLGSVASWLPPGCVRADEVQLLLEAERTDAASDEAMERTREIIERRIAALGGPGATVARQGANRIVVRLGRREDAEQVKLLAARPGRLEFRLVDENVTSEQVESGRAPPLSQILPTAEGGPDGRVAVQRRAIVTGRMIADARADFDEMGLPAVTIRFDATGTRRFARATQENVGRHFAIVLDDVVLSAPVINEPILGGTAQISGSFTVETANQLAIALRSGPLPIRLVVVEERVLAQ